MKKPFNAQEWDELRDKIIGLGENSSKRSYYPELQAKLLQLEKFKALLDNFIDGLIVVNLENGIVEEANKSALSMLKELRIGSTIDPLLDALPIEGKEPFYKISKGLFTAEFENYFINSNIIINGQNRILQFRSNVQKFSNVQYAVIHVSDITEKENSVQAVKTSEANLHALIENTQDLIWSIDNEYKILSLNSSFKRQFFAFFNHELKIGDIIISYLPEDRKEMWIERYNKALHGEYFSFEEQYELNGKKTFNIIAFSPIKNDEIITGATIFLHDITERKKYELAIKESEEQLRKIIEGSPIGIAVSKKHKIDYANSAALTIFGYRDLIQVKNKNISDFLVPKDRKIVDDILAYSLTGSYLTERLEITGVTINQEEIPLYVSMTNVDLFDGTAFVLFFDDVTKQKEVEQALIFAKTKAEESEKLKSEFLAQMSHEIRTPINTILSFSGLINDELHNVVSDDLKNSFEIISRAGNRIIRTIDLILNMSEIQTGTYEVNFQNINLFSEIFLSLANEYIPIAKAKNIDLIVDYESACHTIFGDEYTITQIFSNLIDNAIKYTEKGFVKIYSKKVEGEDKYAVIIEDSGIGISKEYLPSLFNPFSQEERGYTRKFEGNGLGLALVKKYCELNNAEISVESEKNIGTKFIVTLPWSQV